MRFKPFGKDRGVIPTATDTHEQAAGTGIRQDPLMWTKEIIMFNKFMQNEEGATAIEYGLIAALIAVVLITTLSGIGSNLNTKFQSVNSALAK